MRYIFTENGFRSHFLRYNLGVFFGAVFSCVLCQDGQVYAKCVFVGVSSDIECLQFRFQFCNLEKVFLYQTYECLKCVLVHVYLNI